LHPTGTIRCWAEARLRWRETCRQTPMCAYVPANQGRSVADKLLAAGVFRLIYRKISDRILEN